MPVYGARAGAALGATLMAAQQQHAQPPAGFQATVAAAGGGPPLRASADGGFGASPEASSTMVVRHSVDSGSEAWGASIRSPSPGLGTARRVGAQRSWEPGMLCIHMCVGGGGEGRWALKCARV